MKNIIKRILIVLGYTGIIIGLFSCSKKEEEKTVEKLTKVSAVYTSYRSGGSSSSNGGNALSMIEFNSKIKPQLYIINCIKNNRINII